jgi:hypothetical protein
MTGGVNLKPENIEFVIEVVRQLWFLNQNTVWNVEKSRVTINMMLIDNIGYIIYLLSTLIKNDLWLQVHNHGCHDEVPEGHQY